MKQPRITAIWERRFFSWTEKTGRVDPLKVELPTDVTQCADLIMFIMVRKTPEAGMFTSSEPITQPFAYARVPVSMIYGKAEPNPQW